MDYWVDCTCGNHIDVSAAQAGTSVSCRCGKVVQVPSLTELRRQSIAIDDDVSPEFVIRTVYGSGKVAVGGDACACCRAAAAERVLCTIEYEKPFFKRERFWPLWILFGVFSLPVMLYYLAVRRESRLLSEGRSVDVYVTLCSKCQKSAPEKGMLEELLRGEPPFARLLVKYPQAEISKRGSLTPKGQKGETGIQDLGQGNNRHR